ncbi:Zinc/iron permease [Trinorchestia longiramus]|nr:Zinc/iron permease [Trinorchestia longiramus]
MEILPMKLLIMGVIFTCTTFVGISPIILRGACGNRLDRAISLPQRVRLLSLASCFSAGVFMCVCFMGLLPAADEKFHTIMKRTLEGDASLERFTEFPWGFFVVICGFLIMFTIDKLAHAIDMGKKASLSSKAKIRDSPEGDITLISVKGTTTSSLSSLPDGGFEKFPPQDEYGSSKSAEPLTETQYAVGTARGVKQNKDHPMEMQLQISESREGLEERRDYEHAHVEDNEAQAVPSHGHGVPSSLIFLVALGIHSLFEGAAIGLQTQMEKVLEFGVAVLVHELVMAFTFGLEVSRSKRLAPTWQGLYVCLFTVSIPLGIAIGAGLLHTTQSESREVVAAVLEAIATGIFLHVIFIEILAKEFPEHHHEPHPPPTTSSTNTKTNSTKKPQHKAVDYNTVNGSCRREGRENVVSDSEDESQFGPDLEVKTVIKGLEKKTASVKSPSEVRLIVEKIISICVGLLTLILMNVFLHSH